MELDTGVIFIIAGITILSLALFIVTFISYLKSRNAKLVFVSLIFLFLLIRGLLLSIGLFNDHFSSFISSGYIWVFDLIILLLLYIAYSTKR